ncbi:hypothetical protein [Agrobacterium rosae]|uniref:hypothetical protein n=1 Tax=Agrobacterium rosae TaxID=1972867 RepID=UPI003BA12CAF
MSFQVDRSLEDKEMDRIDHALGRPVDPTRETYRDHYATNSHGATGKGFDHSLNWKRGQSLPGGMTYFHVTDHGRQVLKQYLKAIGDNHRLFEVSFKGFTSTVVAVSASKAKYSYWLDVSDTSDISFREFCRSVSVRLACTSEADISKIAGRG